MNIKTLLGIFTIITTQVFAAQLPFTVILPPGFVGPQTATEGPAQMFGFTGPSHSEGFKPLFLVTVVNSIPKAKDNKLEIILKDMLRGVERRRDNFAHTPFTKSSISGVESLSAEWSGTVGDRELKGLMACAISDGRAYVLHFQDTETAWPATRIKAEAAIQTFKFEK
jgi:hypothetical protein